MNVKLLVDENLSPRVAETLRSDDGIDAVHVRDRGLLGGSDRAVLEAAVADDRVVVTSNVADFLELVRAAQVHAAMFEDVPLVGSEAPRR